MSMQLRNLIWCATGVLGLLAIGGSVSSSARAQDLSKVDFAKLGAGAPSNGVVMSQDDSKVYIYDSGRQKAFIISKTESFSDQTNGGLVPMGYIVNTADGTVAPFKVRKVK
jgi:hypothetical protein